jgi:Zn-dependent protease with chaperone function
MAATKAQQPNFSNFGFAKTFLLPAFLIFLIPVVSFLFFRHAQSLYDDRARAEILASIHKDNTLTEEERANAIAFFTAVPISELVKHEEFSSMFDGQAIFDLTAFRWAIRLSVASIIGGVGAFLFAGVCVLLSLRSSFVQFLTLSAGWHVLRIFGAAQVVLQGAMLVALSYWVTAIEFKVYIPKLIFLVAIIAGSAVVMVIRVMFKRLDMKNHIEGAILAPEVAAPLWHKLSSICAILEIDPPDQVVAGIDANFYVTEQDLILDDETIRGRTLFVSLSLLKQLNGREAEAVLAHEMAHFSGQDTVYSKKILPLLIRYGNYLDALRQGVAALPVFYFMVCFRALFELSLRRIGRQREFRADRIAVENTSPRDFAGALLRIVAYSKYRAKIEQELFEKERVLETADIGRQVESGYPAYATAFASNSDLGSEETPHPFDTHPPLSQRLGAAFFGIESGNASAILSVPGDGHWYQPHRWGRTDRAATMGPVRIAFPRDPRTIPRLSAASRFRRGVGDCRRGFSRNLLRWKKRHACARPRKDISYRLAGTADVRRY